MSEQTFTNYTDYTKEEQKSERQPSVGRGIATVAAIGVGLYLVGRFTGMRDGYRLGFNRGIIHTVNNFAEGVEVVLKEQRKSGGA